MSKYFRDREIVVTKSNSVTSWVYWADDPRQFVFQIRTKLVVSK